MQLADLVVHRADPEPECVQEVEVGEPVPHLGEPNFHTQADEFPNSHQATFAAIRRIVAGLSLGERRATNRGATTDRARSALDGIRLRRGECRWHEVHRSARKSAGRARNVDHQHHG